MASTLFRTEPRAKAVLLQNRAIQLDFIRGIAILLVIGHHAITLPSTNVWACSFVYFEKHVGWMGVDIFFVLSGFLVGGLLMQELTKTGSLRVGRFLIRRTMKIWPAYYLFIFYQIALHRHPRSTFLWQNLLNVQNYAGTSLRHTWSLAVEEHFYLILPFLLLWIYDHERLRARTELILISRSAQSS